MKSAYNNDSGTHNHVIGRLRDCINNKLLSILEWICIAAIPVYLLCNHEFVQRTETSTALQQHQVNTYLKSILWILGVTSLLSFTSIIVISRSSKASHNSSNPRKDDVGIVIGAHLVPLMYYALYHSCQKRELSNVSIENDVGLQHVLYSSCGGFSFVISYIIVMTSGRLKRRKSDDEEEESPELHREIMQLCWKVYLALLCTYRAYLMLQYSKVNIHCAQLGFLHIIMIGYYSQYTMKIKGNDQKQWQDAFTCGEWMVLSNLAASLVGDFILYQWTTIDNNNNREFLPEHLRIAHAGLAGCIVGVVICQFTSRILPSLGMFGSVTGVFGIIAGFLEVTVNPPLIGTKHGDWILFLPKSIRWLVQFLSHEVEMEIGTSLNHVQRYVILGYWGFVLIASVPLTMKLCSWVQWDDTEHNLVRKKRRVVAARKFFHLIALLLFTPITWLDPDMMALSYAIAVALLMVIEVIRCYNFGLEKGSIISSSLNAFYTTFLDEKDSIAAEGGLVITHITLILGSAIPLWMYQMIVNLSGENKVPIFFLPYVGVVALGVGDSVGAIAGLTFGRHFWSGSSRTIEGSCCMFLSMLIPLYLVSVEDLFDIGKTLAIVTLAEASTRQIDNLCLPLIGTTLVALAASS